MRLAPQRRAIFRQFFDICTSKSGLRVSVFYDFDFKMCFSPQRRAIFRHRNFKKWPEPVARGAFWLKMCFSPQRRAIFRHRNFKKWPEPVARGAFWLKMCFSLQRRAIFPHHNFKKWSETVSFLTFWLWNVLLATAACHFSTSQLQKVVWDRQFFNILTLKCASRHSGVPFFHIATSKSGLRMSVF